MAIEPFPPIDHQAKAESRVITQYRESTNLLDMNGVYLNQSQELEQVFQDLINKRSINTATGINLDNIGEIVGQSRQVEDQVLTDDDYRKFIKARIVRNYTTSTIEEVIASVIFILDAPQVQVVEGGAQISVGIGKILTPEEVNLVTNLGIVPKTAGVSIDYFEYDSTAPFSYRSVTSSTVFPSGSGLGTVSNPAFGGQYASIV